MRTLLAILILSFALPAVAKDKPTVTVTTDRFTGVTTVVMRSLPLITTQDRMCMLTLSAAASGVTPTLAIQADCGSWMFPNSFTAHVLIDGQREDLDFVVGRSEVTLDYPQTHALLLSHVPRDVFDRIAKAQTFEMELGRYVVLFKPKALESLKEFDAAMSTLGTK